MFHCSEDDNATIKAKRKKIVKKAKVDPSCQVDGDELREKRYLAYMKVVDKRKKRSLIISQEVVYV